MFASPAAAQGSPDLSVTQTESADPVRSGDDVTYTVTVTNEGSEPIEAAMELMTIRRPQDPDRNLYDSMTPSQGDCDVDGSFARCELGMLAAGVSANVVAVLRARDSMEHRVTLLSCDEFGCSSTDNGQYVDDDASDNVSVEATRVIVPPFQKGSDQIRFTAKLGQGSHRIEVKVTPGTRYVEDFSRMAFFERC